MSASNPTAVAAKLRQSSYDFQELIASGHGELEGMPQLPLPPMLMFDRITKITADGGKYGKGSVQAELEIRANLWFFACHFKGDPVMPGCLGADALWQLTGFFIGWSGAIGMGRALKGCFEFSGQVFPTARLLTYQVDIKQLRLSPKFSMGVADAHLECDGKIIYLGTDLKVGVFPKPLG